MKSGPISIETLPDLSEKISSIESDERVYNGWLHIGCGSRVFGLPKTHYLCHEGCDDSAKIGFLVWGLSFFTGMRLTTTEAGFLDATPIKMHSLVDFHTTDSTLGTALELCETFWNNNKHIEKHVKWWAAAVHALFLSKNPKNLQFESFILLYIALDACAALTEPLRERKRPVHNKRIDWMCSEFGIPVPEWASLLKSENENESERSTISVLRNALIHEALFLDEPLGFALHGIGTNQNITLEMQGLVCRLLVALIGGGSADYIHTPVSTRMAYGLRLA